MKKLTVLIFIIFGFGMITLARRVAPPTPEEINKSNEKKELFYKALNQKIVDLKESLDDLKSITVGATFFSADDYQNMIDLLNCDCKQKFKQLKQYSTRMY